MVLRHVAAITGDKASFFSVGMLPHWPGGGVMNRAFLGRGIPNGKEPARTLRHFLVYPRAQPTPRWEMPVSLTSR